MAIADNKLLVRRYYEDVVSTGRVDRIPEFISPDYVEIHENTRYAVGIDGATRHVQGVRLTYPDLRLEVTRQIAEGDLVASEVVMRGTHLGEWLGIAPTGKALVVNAVNIDRVVDGRIVEHGGAANLLEPLRRIGAIRVVGPDLAQ